MPPAGRALHPLGFGGRIDCAPMPQAPGREGPAPLFLIGMNIQPVVPACRRIGVGCFRKPPGRQDAKILFVHRGGAESAELGNI